MTEYIIIVGLIAILLVGVIMLFGDSLERAYAAATIKLDDSVVTSIGPDSDGDGDGSGDADSSTTRRLDPSAPAPNSGTANAMHGDRLPPVPFMWNPSTRRFHHLNPDGRMSRMENFDDPVLLRYFPDRDGDGDADPPGN
jgi:Flp pilus assembly pilin Flp